MTLQEFTYLDHDCKIVALRYAVCIGARSEGDFNILLYQLNSFYIEVCQHTQFWYNCVVKCFDNLDRLEPYLEKIDIKLAY